ncbi:response regulator transcription factor [Acanthopleuribacter pedis]|uniref:Response regulator n=1 Tax=Acanthopleuribacter pedis TaxID=442870 RepID=A0A8J7Q2A1_9BACT|nr:response regulator [Acanthopleuribacter pedis]MBO1317955.1 response regulator [Acanthopleuribacter pedis]
MTSPPTAQRVLLLEDDQNLAETLALEFEDVGILADILPNETGLSDYLTQHQPDWAVIDLRLDGGYGLTALKTLLAAVPDCFAVVLTGYGTVTAAVEAMKLGARDFLTKPIRFENLLAVLQQAQPVPARPDPDQADLNRQSLARNEQEYIAYVLNRCNGNISQAAAWLGIHRQSLQRKLKKYPPHQ